MSEPQLESCSTCPAFLALTGEKTFGVCRAHAPVALQDREFFRGSTRSMLFGAYPSVGTFPLVQATAWCMEHPVNRGFWAKGVRAAPPPDAPPVPDNIDEELKEHTRKPEPPSGSAML